MSLYLNVMQDYIYSNIIAITSEPCKPGFCPKTGETSVSIGFTLYSNTKKETQAYYNTFVQNHGGMLFYRTDIVIREHNKASKSFSRVMSIHFSRFNTVLLYC